MELREAVILWKQKIANLSKTMQLEQNLARLLIDVDSKYGPH
jgi:hypothetical protein